jgi:glycosyltransferase involved in cell wall biosynthesis
MIENRDIVIVGLQPWDTEIGSNCKDIAMAFAQKNRVLYVNYPLDRGTLWKNRKDPKVALRRDVISGKKDGLVEIQPGFWQLYPDEILESINALPDGLLFDMANRVNGKRYARSIGKAIQRLGFSNFILFNDNDLFKSFYLKDFLRPALSIFYFRDFLLGVDYWKKHGNRLEPLLIAKSDICCTNSLHFETYCRKYNPNSFYVGQGCDLSLFLRSDSIPVPADMQSYRKPVIGYVGALQSLRLDLDVIRHIAVSRPGWQVVLVGPEDRQFAASDLHSVPNIHFLGSRPPHTLPEYIHAFDVCLNPQLINEVTVGNYPRKVDEYLAMGKPVVATRTAFMEAIFNAYTYLGVTADEYVALIEKALAEDAPALQAARKAFAATHTWEANVEEISRHIRTFETDNRRSS